VIRSRRFPILFALLIFIATAALAQDAIILQYHEVDPMPVRGWGVTSEDFAEQMQFLAKTGYNVIPIADLVDYVYGKRASLRPNPVVITDDDGWLCAYTEMDPVLKRFGFPWSLYIYPKIIGRGSHALSWSQVETLAANGVDVESHTMSHADLTRKGHPSMNDAEYAAFLRAELEESREVIESHTKHPVHFIAYPFGNYDNVVTAAARHAGYTAGLVSWLRPNKRTTDPMKLGRFKMVSNTSLDQFSRALAPALVPLRDVSPDGVLAKGQTTISASIDDTQLDPVSIHAMLLTEDDVEATYDPASHRVTLTLKGKFHHERQTAIVEAMTKQGQRAISLWTFYTSDAAKKKYDALNEKLSRIPLQDGEGAQQ
jgi:peptidoglycan/xylan/chitin deacetylase (PgdA/CDA1 family)